jgi:hypothetical protein
MYLLFQIVGRWVEREETWPYPDNAHLTQSLWRASRYIGCGESVKELDDGTTCRVQVCRYQKPGHCNMASYDATEGENWLVPMLEDHSDCGNACPSEGCF